MLIDSHCHLNMLEEYPKQIDSVLQAAKTHDVTHMLCVCVSLDKFAEIIALAEKYDQISASVGVHPNEEMPEEADVELLLQLADHEKVVAIGETGLDYFRSTDDDMSWQQERFVRHIEAAQQSQKPLIIHTRNAPKDTITFMRQENARDAGGVMHCFTETWEMAKQALDLGFYISISGIVTFKNAEQIQYVAKQVPLDRLLIETDAPYLAPVPHRGKPNQPAFVRHTAEYIAQLRGIDFASLANATTENYWRFVKQSG